MNVRRSNSIGVLLLPKMSMGARTVARNVQSA
jgi:hypothetical protein